MIGRIVECDGEQIIQTLAGATAGTVCKVGYDSNQDYALPLVLNELGEGYVGISCDETITGPTYNPTTGVLKVCCVESESATAAGADCVLANGIDAAANYNLAFWTATADGCYCPMGFSSGCAITYNPSTATLTSCTVNGCMICASCMVVTNSVYSGTTLSLCGCDGGITIDCSGNVDFNDHNATGICTTGTTHLCLTETADEGDGAGQLLFRCSSNNCLYPTDCITYDGGVTTIYELDVENCFSACSEAYFGANAHGDSWCITTTGNACFDGCLQVCGGIAGEISNSKLTCCMQYSDWGCCAVTAYSSSSAFEGSAAGWANYLLFAHGCGSSYYGQAIRMPFSSYPQYMRRVNGTVCGWYDFITEENISCQAVCSATALCVDSTVCAIAERNNQLNICSASCNITWINYRGGSSILNIGDGTGNGQYGTLNAKCIYGSTCVYSNGSPTITVACFNCCLCACCVPTFCISGNTLVICTR